MTLEEASVAKLERVCEQLQLGPSDHLVEIGTGWGGLAVHAAATRGCRVTTTTISEHQHAYAVERVREAGLQDRVEVLLSDYRDLRGSYDKLVSIEMIEAVGWQHIGTFFERCSELLHSHGAMLLQAITIDDRAYEVEKASKSFIKEYIFPGGCLPSMEVIMRNVARHTDLQAVGLKDITASYVETLRRWRENLAGEPLRARAARLRRALSSAVDVVSLLLRGRIRRATDLRCAAFAGQAPMGRTAHTATCTVPAVAQYSGSAQLHLAILSPPTDPVSRDSPNTSVSGPNAGRRPSR